MWKWLLLYGVLQVFNVQWEKGIEIVAHSKESKFYFYFFIFTKQMLNFLFVFR